jgi:hypothetical protein
MKPLSETLTELGIAFSFPIEIKNTNGYQTYYEDSDGYWRRYERDANGDETYYENSDSYWRRYERDVKGRPTYYENSNGFWRKREYDANGNVTYFEDSNGCKEGIPRSQSCDGKVIEIDGKKYKLTEL